MGTQVDGARVSNVEYNVRQYRPDDLEAFLELHETVFGQGRGREWFAWKYEDNPYVYHVPILVVEHDDDLVGARPFFALELSVKGNRHVALQPGDTMVHPDHRRQGVFTRMNEVAIETYRDCDVSFFFNFPNEKSGAGYLKLGWERVTEHPTYYRVHDAAALQQSTTGNAASLATRGLQPFLAGYNKLSSLRLDAPDDVTVERYDAIPSETLAGIEYDRRRSGIHVHRDVRFYDWRFGNPAWDYTAYVAETGGEPIAGMVVGESTDDATVARVTDVTPLPRGAATDGLEALLAHVLEAHADADLLAAPPVLSEDLASKAGFRRDDRPPLSAVGSTTTHVVRGLGRGTDVDGVDVTDPDNWQLSFAERDTS